MQAGSGHPASTGSCATCENSPGYQWRSACQCARTRGQRRDRWPTTPRRGGSAAGVGRRRPWITRRERRGPPAWTVCAVPASFYR